MASRKLSDLKPEVERRAKRLLSLCIENELTILIYCTYRSVEEQARLYRQGHGISDIRWKASELEDEFGRPDLAELLMAVGPQKGPRVTNAGPGQSLHNYGYALDAVPVVGGKPLWSTRTALGQELWGLYGQLAKDVGFEWAGDWPFFVEFPHIQEPEMDWRKLIRNITYVKLENK